MQSSFVPPGSKGAALIATTGNDVFASHVRKSAQNLKLRFTEYGLWRFNPATKQEQDQEHCKEQEQDQEREQRQEEEERLELELEQELEQEQEQELEQEQEQEQEQERRRKKYKQPEGQWELLPSESEEIILDELGIDWVGPEERNSGCLEEALPKKYRKKY
jgi:DNA polymerase/3'-5' exonuclease PolX